MDRDTFIIVVYCLVVEHYHALTAHRPLRHGGFLPTLSDEEVITMEICSEYFKLTSDKDIWQYFRTHYRHFFPALGDRTLFGRQAANLWQVKAAIQQRLTHVSGQAQAPIQPIDTLPLPVCVYTRSRRDRCLKPYADYGYCAAKDLYYYGFKLGLRISRIGMITHYPLLAARPHDINHLEALVEDGRGLVPADKGFIDAHKQALLAERHAIMVVTPPRARMQPAHPRGLLKACGRWRKLIETVGSHLTERFAVERIRVHDLWHYQHRLIRKVLAHTVAVFLNLQMGRPPLDLDGLVTA
jgi:Transposase DDE domain